VNDLRAGPDLSLNEHADKRRVNAVAQVRAVIDWSQVSVQGVRVHTQPPHLPASHAASGFSSLGDSAGSSSSRSPTLGSTRRLLGGSRDTASTASVPLTMLTEVRTDAALEPSTPVPLPGGAAQDDIQEGEGLRARLLRQERDRSDLFVVDTLTSAGGRDKHGAVLERNKLAAGDAAITSVPAPPVSAPARPAVERQEDGGGEGWEDGHILQGALRALGWSSSPQVSRLERVVEQELLAQYTL
jgi:hypothetical protein